MRKKQIAVIDVGSSKITAIIGERGVNNTFLIKARKEYNYEGFADGEFFDEANVKRILFSAAEFIGGLIDKKDARVFVGVPGEFTKVYVKSSQISFNCKKRITDADVDSLFDAAFVSSSAKYSLINRSAIVYELDDYRRLANPIGATSEILKGKLSFILCDNAFFNTFKSTGDRRRRVRFVRACGSDVSNRTRIARQDSNAVRRRVHNFYFFTRTGRRDIVSAFVLVRGRVYNRRAYAKIRP